MMIQHLERFRRVVAAILLAMAAAGPSAAASPELELVFERYNGVYQDLEAGVEPIRSGPLTILLSSPRHRLELLSHRIRLTPAAAGGHDLLVSVRFAGSGELNAELDFGGLPATLEDQVEFPEQERVVEAEISIERVEGGYRLTALELPARVTIEMKSTLGNELVTWCERLAFFLAGDAGCDELDGQLSHPSLPLPAAGSSYLVSADELTSEERARIDRYLEQLD